MKIQQVPALLIAAVTLGAISFVSIFVIGFTVGSHASLPVMLGVWCFLIASALAAYLWASIRNGSRAYDLVLDRFRNQVTLPIFKDRRLPKTLPLGDIRKASYTYQQRQDSEGDWSTEYHVQVELIGGATDQIAEFSNSTDTKRLCNWLNQEWFGYEEE